MTLFRFLPQALKFFVMSFLLLGINAEVLAQPAAAAGNITGGKASSSSSITFYWSAPIAKEYAERALNIYVNNQYFTSIHQGKRSVALNLMPGDAVINVVPADQRTGTVADTRLSGQKDIVSVNSGEAVLYQVALNDRGVAEGRRDSRSPDVMTMLPVDHYTISRVQPKHQVMQEENLAKRFFFPLGKYERTDMNIEELRKIREFAKFLRQKYASLEAINVNGYTDPVGSRQNNKRISEQRASTVADLLSEAGVVTNRVIVTGFGSESLVVKGCNEMHRDKREISECNAPNRRVEVVVH